jgi:hypothetical protein
VRVVRVELKGILTGFQIQRLDAQLELSEAPLDEASSEFIRARASLSALVHRSAVGAPRLLLFSFSFVFCCAAALAEAVV